jgi:myo-inositol 2-dehydrogenase/D-chiro-inositol 1-dehydrogenase
MSKTKVGVVGYGRFSRMHIKALSQIPDAELGAICVASQDSFQIAKREQTEVPIFLNYSEFLDSETVDAVDITSPNHTHSKLAEQALDGGKDVYLEKPISTTLEEARKIVDAERKTEMVLHVGFENRYSSFWKSVKETLDREEIGDPVFGKIDSWRFPLREGSQGWKYDRQKVGHQLFEEAIHYVDLANWMFDSKPLTVFGFIDDKESLSTGHLKNAWFVIEFEGGQRFLVTDNLQGFGSDLSVSVSGKNGSVIGAVRAESDDSQNVDSYLKLRNKDSKTSTASIHLSGQLADLTASLADFIDSVRAFRKSQINIEEGFNALAVCIAALKSMGNNGQREKVELLL